MKSYFVWLLLALFGWTACSSSDDVSPSDLLEVRYGMTQCADPWLELLNTNAPIDDTNRAQAIREYLRQNGIEQVENIRFEKDPKVGESVCMACNCPSGQQVRLSIRAADWSKAEKLGFEK